MDNKDEQAVDATTGFIAQSLGRSNKQIRAERGDAAQEDLEMVYKREVEDWQVKVKRLTRKRMNGFDFSPTNTQSLVMGKDLDADDIKEKDLALAQEIYNATIKLRLAIQSYNFLFGATYDVPTLG